MSLRNSTRTSSLTGGAVSSPANGAFIRRARELGFTLDEIRALLALAADGGRQACVEVRGVAARHLADVRAKIANLRAMESILADAVHRCDEGEPTDFPLINALSSE